MQRGKRESREKREWKEERELRERRHFREKRVWRDEGEEKEKRDESIDIGKKVGEESFLEWKRNKSLSRKKKEGIKL